MKVITRALLRKRSEHNEGIISTLEEISLHQEELLGINAVLGATCRKLKILYLQNNCISKIENLVHLKELTYLNMALNNIEKIEGLQNCEFLTKFDLTANFVDFDELQSSIEHLACLERLSELYMMGNPCQANWPGFELYVIAKIPQLHSLDGKEITRSMQITARQQLPALEAELVRFAVQSRVDKAHKLQEKLEQQRIRAEAEAKAIQDGENVECIDVESEDEDGISDRDKLTENTPETRYEIYKELAEQKKEKEDREAAMRPRERDYQAEHTGSVSTLRQKEAETPESEIKQKNEGGWNFKWDEESRAGFVLLEVDVSRFLDSSLLDVDIHPSYVSIIIKGKLLRLRTPAEVKVSESKCQRSKTTGSLLVVMPKVNPRENAISIRADTKSRASSTTNSIQTLEAKALKKAGSGRAPKLTLQEQMIAEALEAKEKQSAQQPSKAVDIRNIVKRESSI